MTQDGMDNLFSAATLGEAGALPLGIIGVVIIGIVIALVGFFVVCYRRCSAGKVLVVLGGPRRARTFRLVHAGGALTIPGVHRCCYLSTDPIRVELSREWCQTSDAKRIWLSGVYSVCLATDPETIERAVYRLIERSDGEIGEICAGIIAATVRRTISGSSSIDAAERRIRLENSCNKAIDAQLAHLGMELVSGRIRELTDATELPIAI